MLGKCVFAPTNIIWQQEDVRASWRFDRLRGKRRMKAQSCVCYLGCDVNKDEIIVLFKSQLFGVSLFPLHVFLYSYWSCFNRITLQMFWETRWSLVETTVHCVLQFQNSNFSFYYILTTSMVAVEDAVEFLE